MARTTQKTRTQKARRRVTRDLPPNPTSGKTPKGGAVTPHAGGMLVGMGDGSVRMGDGSVVPGDGSVKTIKPSI